MQQYITNVVNRLYIESNLETWLWKYLHSVVNGQAPQFGRRLVHIDCQKTQPSILRKPQKKIQNHYVPFQMLSVDNVVHTYILSVC